MQQPRDQTSELAVMVADDGTSNSSGALGKGGKPTITGGSMSYSITELEAGSSYIIATAHNECSQTGTHVNVPVVDSSSTDLYWAVQVCAHTSCSARASCLQGRGSHCMQSTHTDTRTHTCWRW